jgi:type I restriction enzyme R subunit
VYTYSLKQGIDDGFLAPYKVIRIDIDKDLQGWRPEKGQSDKHGNLIEDRIYNQKDFDRTLVLEKRTELVARKVTEFLSATDPYAKTIVFCDDIDHAERMRQALVNLNPERVKENRKFIMRITGDEAEGKAELDNFINPESRYPVIATTSKLMTTGVDAQTCKLIVLDQRIQSMTEFKQIIGRGTRINEDFDKFWFSIMDFKKATELFADPDFDGPPEQIYEPKGDQPPVPPDDEAPQDGTGQPVAAGEPEPPLPPDTGGGEKRVKYVLGGEVAVYVIAERVQYYGPDGKLITESLKDYTRRAVRKEYASLDDFLRRWSSANRKKAVIEELEAHGVILDALADEVAKKHGRGFDPFDLVCHVVFDCPPLTRKERAEQLKKRDAFAKYGDKARTVLNALVEKYADTDIESIEDIKILTLDPFTLLGTTQELIQSFGGKPAYLSAIHELETQLYG